MKRLTLVFLVLLSSVCCNEKDEVLRSFLISNFKFQAEVFDEVLVAKQEANVFFSPMGVTFLMSYIYFGAKSSTMEEIRNTLYLPEKSIHLQIAIRALRELIATSKRAVLVAYIKVFVKDEFPIKDEFQMATRHSFVNCCEVGQIDFKNADAAQEINQWSNMYNDTRIIVNQSECNSQTRLLPINPLYFTANWLHPFEAANTKPRDFYVSQSKTSKVVAMETTGYFKYFESTKLDSKIVELEFHGRKAGFVIVLPNQKNGLQKLDGKINQHDLLRTTLRKKKLRVVLPRFFIETATHLKPILNKMGVVKAFDKNQADFSGLSGKPGDLFLTDIIQKAFVNVDENGIVAEATSSGANNNKSLLSKAKSVLQRFDPHAEDFIIDHPFIFYIKLYGIPLFAGRVIDPNLIEYS